MHCAALSNRSKERHSSTCHLVFGDCGKFMAAGIPAVSYPRVFTPLLLPSLPPPSWGLQGLISNDLDPQRQSLGLPGYGGENEIARRIVMSDPLVFLSLIRSQRASICGGFSPSKRDCHVSRDRGTQESWLMISHQQCERLFPRSISRIFV